MKRMTAPIIFAACLVLTLPPQGLQAIQNCGTQSLKGVFSVIGLGSVVDSPLPDLIGPFGRVGQAELDGKGNVTAFTTASYNGIIISEPFGGTYVVSPDCTVVFDLLVPFPGLPPGVLLPVTFDGVIADNGRQVGAIAVFPPGTTIHVQLEEQREGKCSNQDLSKSFLLNMSGTIISQPGVPPGAFSRVGWVVFNSSGEFVAGTLASYDGLLATEEFAGTYSVDPSCNFTMHYVLGQAYTWTGIVTNRGRGANLIVSNPAGAAVVGTLTQQ